MILGGDSTGHSSRKGYDEMATAFLLRFQEECFENDAEAVRCGTQTNTKIQGEQPDPDPSSGSLFAVPRSQSEAGTLTGTRIKTEQSDADRHSAASAIPDVVSDLSMGTKTVTNVQAEVDDEDPGKCRMRMIPRCSSY